MKPFPYQCDCLDALKTARDNGYLKALVVMATGLGKTVVSALDIQRLLKKAPGRVLYLCHQNDILRQARATFEEILGNSYSYGYFHGTEKHRHRVDMLFASFQTMATNRELFARDEFRYIVVDEVHHAHAATFRPTIEYFTPEFLLGLTATPKRGDGLDITELFGKLVFNLDLFKALARRYLCDVDYRVMTDEIQNAKVLDTPIGKLSIAELNRTLFIPKRDEEIVRIISEKVAEVQNPRVMIFCTSIKHAERMAALMPHAAVVHSKLKHEDRNKRLNAFRSGEVGTILTVDMLNEGINVREANVIVFLRSTSSPMIFLQQLGRGLRKALGKLKVIVLDFVANCERVEMIDELGKGVKAAGGNGSGGQTTCGDGDETDEPFVLTVDGIEFDERVIKLFEVIRDVRAGYTQEELITQVQALQKELGRVPTAIDARRASAEGKIATQTTFARIIGKWNDVLIEAGFQPNRTVVVADRDDLISQVKVLAAYVGRPPTTTDLEEHRVLLELSSVKTFRREFGPWPKVLEAAEIGTDVKLEILAQLRALAEKRGKKELTRSEIDKASRDECPHSKTILRHFGSWHNLKDALGWSQKKARRTDEELKKALSTLHASIKRPLTNGDIHGAMVDGVHLHMATLTKRFGSPETACKAAGVPYRFRKDTKKYTDQEALALLRKSIERRKGLATKRQLLLDWHLGRLPSLSIYKRFGGVDAAISRLGLLPLTLMQGRRIDRTEIIEQLNELTEGLGRPLIEEDVLEASRRTAVVAAKAIEREFGSISKAVNSVNAGK